MLTALTRSKTNTTWPTMKAEETAGMVQLFEEQAVVWCFSCTKPKVAKAGEAVNSASTAIAKIVRFILLVTSPILALRLLVPLLCPGYRCESGTTGRHSLLHLPPHSRPHNRCIDTGQPEGRSVLPLVFRETLYRGQRLNCCLAGRQSLRSGLTGVASQ